MGKQLNQKLCCFCGGSTPATTNDHQPARILFPNRHRPKGFEFPACKRCNEQTRADEPLLAFVSRVTGGHRKNAQFDPKQFKNAMRSIERRYPGLLARIHRPTWMRYNGVLRKTGAFDMNQPEMSLSICRMAAKLCLATYFLESGKIASDCELNTQWTHNQNAAAASHVREVLSMLPQGQALRQGKWDVSDSFYVRYHMEGDEFLMAAVFHQSVVLMAEMRKGAPPAPYFKWDRQFSPKPETGITLINDRSTPRLLH